MGQVTYQKPQILIQCWLTSQWRLVSITRQKEHREHVGWLYDTPSSKLSVFYNINTKSYFQHQRIMFRSWLYRTSNEFYANLICQYVYLGPLLMVGNPSTIRKHMTIRFVIHRRLHFRQRGQDFWLEWIALQAEYSIVMTSTIKRWVHWGYLLWMRYRSVKYNAEWHSVY